MRMAFIIAMTFASHVSCPAFADAGTCSSPLSAREPRLPFVSFTNHAGRVVSGAFGGVTNNAFVVNGKAYPLSVLPKGEILRAKKLAGLDVRTAKQKRLDHAREMNLARIRAREDEGEIDKDTADRLRQEATSTVPSR